jgi:hypothetical protein
MLHEVILDAAMCINGFCGFGYIFPGSPDGERSTVTIPESTRRWLTKTVTYSTGAGYNHAVTVDRNTGARTRSGGVGIPAYDIDGIAPWPSDNWDQLVTQASVGGNYVVLLDVNSRFQFPINNSPQVTLTTYTVRLGVLRVPVGSTSVSFVPGWNLCTSYFPGTGNVYYDPAAVAVFYSTITHTLTDENTPAMCISDIDAYVGAINFDDVLTQVPENTVGQVTIRLGWGPPTVTTVTRYGYELPDVWASGMVLGYSLRAYTLGMTNLSETCVTRMALYVEKDDAYSGLEIVFDQSSVASNTIPYDWNWNPWRGSMWVGSGTEFYRWGDANAIKGDIVSYPSLYSYATACSDHANTLTGSGRAWIHGPRYGIDSSAFGKWLIIDRNKQCSGALFSRP